MKSILPGPRRRRNRIATSLHHAVVVALAGQAALACSTQPESAPPCIVYRPDVIAFPTKDAAGCATNSFTATVNDLSACGITDPANVNAGQCSTICDFAM